MQLHLRRFRPVVASLLAAGLVAVVAAQSAFADPRDFTLINNSSIELHSVFVAPASSSDWEEDLLAAADVVPPGGALDITFPDETASPLVGAATTDGLPIGGASTVSTCVYNVKVVGARGEAGFLYSVDLCSAQTVIFTDAGSTSASQ